MKIPTIRDSKKILKTVFAMSFILIYAEPGFAVVYEVKQAGGGDFSAIQDCAAAAQPGDTCQVYPGNYGRTDTIRFGQDVKSGESGKPITFSGLEGAISNGFYVRGDYFVIEGFEFTGDVDSIGQSMVEVDGNHVIVRNNEFYGLAPTYMVRARGMILLKGSYNHAHHNIIRDWQAAFSEPTAITSGSVRDGIIGTNNIVENNIIRDCSDIDVFESFGKDNTIRNNLVLNIYDGLEEIKTHIDLIQTFGNQNTPSYNFVFENNFVSGLSGQLGQLVQSCGLDSNGSVVNANNCSDRSEMNGFFTSVSGNAATDTNQNWLVGNWGPDAHKNKAVTIISGAAKGNVYIVAGNNANTLQLNNPDDTPANIVNDGIKAGDGYEIRIRIGWWTFRNNVLHNIKLGLSSSMPHFHLINNTFINTGGVFSGGSVNRGRSVNGIVKNNIFVTDDYVYSPQAIGAYPEGDFLIKETFTGDYNFASNMNPGFAAKDERCSEEYTFLRFCEAVWPGKHGINGGDPGFQNINDPLGPDSLPFTSDDGVKLLFNSRLKGAGDGGLDLGANPGLIFLPNDNRKPNKQEGNVGFIKFKNIFNPAQGEILEILFASTEATAVTVTIRNRQGAVVKELVIDAVSNSNTSVIWDGRNANRELVSSGLYTVHINSGSSKESKKVVVVK